MSVQHILSVFQAEEIAFCRLGHRTDVGPAVKVAQPLYSQKPRHVECDGVAVEWQIYQLIEEVFWPGIVSNLAVHVRSRSTNCWRGKFASPLV